MLYCLVSLIFFVMMIPAERPEAYMQVRGYFEKNFCLIIMSFGMSYVVQGTRVREGWVGSNA